MKAIDDKTKWLVEFDKYLTKLEELDKAYDYANTPGTTLFKEYNAFANIMKKINSKNTAVDFLSQTTCNIYLQTMDKAVNAIEEYTNVYFDNYLTSYLNDGSLKYILFVYRPDYNFWDKIRHETKCMQFCEAELWMIKEARIVVKIKGQSGEHVSLLTPALYEKKNSMFSADEYGIEFTSRGFGGNPLDAGKQNIEYFNLEIKWHNDFVTTIPICDEYSVIDRASTRLNAYVYLRSAFYKDAYSTDLLPYGMEVLKVKDITK